MSERWRSWAREVKRDVLAIALCLRDPRTPWFAKLLAVGIVAYALSPIDLIPDFIPVLGHLDDVVLIPLGILAVRRLIPPQVLLDCREQAAAAISQGKPVSWWGAAIVVALWLAGLAAVIYLFSHSWRSDCRRAN